MKRTWLMTWTMVAALAVRSAAAAAPATKLDRLGKAPLCEASAARALPCPTAVGEGAPCVVVGDNERKGEVFLFRVDEGGKLVDQSALPLTPKVEDVESIERRGDGRLWIVGSHGRKSTRSSARRPPIRLGNVRGG